MDERRINSLSRGLDKHIVELINAWAEAQKVESDLDEFKSNYRAPEPPDKFETVRDLAEYNEQERRYNEQLTERVERAKSCRQTFEQKEAQLLGSFPEDVPLIYSTPYFRYEILKTVSEDGRPSIQIRELD